MVLKKCYLLAGVMMAANIFVVNEVKATEEKIRPPKRDKVPNTNEMGEGNLLNINIPAELNDENQKEKIISEMNKKILHENYNKIQNMLKENNKPVPILHILSSVSGFILSWENTINFTIGSALSLANNYFKWWDYNNGVYRKWGCTGWRSGRFANGIFQFDINVNLGRGFSWLISGLYKFIYGAINKAKFDSKEKDTYYYFYSSCLFFEIGNKMNETIGFFAFFIAFCLQGFVSMPLAIHMSTFDFTIALDSLIWVGVCYLSNLKDNTKKRKYIRRRGTNNNLTTK